MPTYVESQQRTPAPPEHVGKEGAKGGHQHRLDATETPVGRGEQRLGSTQAENHRDGYKHGQLVHELVVVSQVSRPELHQRVHCQGQGTQEGVG